MAISAKNLSRDMQTAMVPSNCDTSTTVIRDVAGNKRPKQEAQFPTLLHTPSHHTNRRQALVNSQGFVAVVDSVSE